MALPEDLFDYLQEKVHVFRMKPDFSEPKIYTGGVDITNWSKLAPKAKKMALAKSWYVYYSFRDPNTGKLTRQKNLKLGANRFKTKTARFKYLKKVQRHLLLLLDYGFNPYEDNSHLMQQFWKDIEGQVPTGTRKGPDKDNAATQDGTSQSRHSIPWEPKSVTGNSKSTNLDKTNPGYSESTPRNSIKQPSDTKPSTSNTGEEVLEITPTNQPRIGCNEAIDKVLAIKKASLSPTSYSRYKSRLHKFCQWLTQNHQGLNSIDEVSKQIVSQYLNEELLRTSPKSRNNVRADLSACFQVLEDQEVVAKNFVKSIKKLKERPLRNRAFTPSQVKELFNFLQNSDPILYLFVLFIYYNFLRPIEVCRLQVKDLDLKAGKLQIQTKTERVTEKIIPEVLLHQLPESLNQASSQHFVFTPNGFAGPWPAQEDNKRNYFSNRFRKVKKIFGFGKEYGLYSFRHSAASLLYRRLEREHGALAAKSQLMAITGHKDQKALEAYLRDINASLPDDYSYLFQD